jgi:hypothetical protein
MGTNIGIWEVPDGKDIKEVFEMIGTNLEKCYEFIQTSPISLKVITFVNNLFRPIL